MGVPAHIYIYNERQPVGLAEVPTAREASLGGPGGRACKRGQYLRVFVFFWRFWRRM